MCSSCSLLNNDGTVSCSTCGYTNPQAILKYPGSDDREENTATKTTDNPGSVSFLDDVGKFILTIVTSAVVRLTYSAKYTSFNFDILCVFVAVQVLC